MLNEKELERINQIKELQKLTLYKIHTFEKKEIMDVDEIELLKNKYFKLENELNKIINKQKMVGDFLITLDKESEFLSIHLQDGKYEETIDFYGLFIDIDKDYNILNIEIEYGNLEKIFDKLTEDDITNIVNVATNLINSTLILDTIYCKGD